MDNSMYHVSVLLNESVESLQIKPGGTYVDATFGGGGHSDLILNKLGGKGRLFAFDQDEDARQNATKAPFAGNDQFSFIHANFRHLKRMVRAEGVRVGTVDGILADLGVSSHQLDSGSRGFSYRFDAELDMRMDTREGPTAADVLNQTSAVELQQILSELGEVRNAKTLAEAIVRFRENSPFKTTGELTALCEKYFMGDRMRYQSQVFQALRMHVNDELGALKELLESAYEMLAVGGRLSVITFHSLEDRMVKNFMKTGNVEGIVKKDFYGNIDRPWELVTKKPIEPSHEEIKNNTRARSSKLRVAEKKTAENQ
ncbi:MAG: 16S rRNA (cytosine(1402)-N(4))-methyltransferase RsmH [Saprospiraceae bacterium]|nr:16S rRNA (cytosine(1402)-N(4))-methyltransferase RsmH [Saprospiraceae bacterium]